MIVQGSRAAFETSSVQEFSHPLRPCCDLPAQSGSLARGVLSILPKQIQTDAKIQLAHQYRQLEIARRTSACQPNEIGRHYTDGSESEVRDTAGS